MILLFTSFLAGALTVLAPCVVAFVPVMLARTATNQRQPWVILASLALSVIVFSILLKSTTLLIDIPNSFWSVVSGGIVLVFGIITLWPSLWEKISLRLGLMLGAQQQLAKAGDKGGFWGDVLVGAAMGPVFSACSPTYALIVATILPTDFLTGTMYLLSYVAGLTAVLVLIMLLGRSFTQRLKWGVNPESSFHRVLGIVLVMIGVLILTGMDKYFLTLLVENGWFDWQIDLESGLTSR